MILGWQQGHSVGRYVLVDTMFPWMALHFGREALRIFTERETKLRDVTGSEGMRRMRYGLMTAVKEEGDTELRVWPVGKGIVPRAWTDADRVWREALTDLKRFVGAELACCTRLEWQPGDSRIERSQTVPTLQGINGFYGWRRGEHEPTAAEKAAMRDKLQQQLIAGKPAGISSGVQLWR